MSRTNDTTPITNRYSFCWSTRNILCLWILCLSFSFCYAQSPSRQSSIAVMQQIAKEMNARCPEKESDNLIMKSVKYSQEKFYFTFSYTDPNALNTESSKLFLYVMIKYAYAADLGKIVFKPNVKKYFSVAKPSFTFTTYNKINHITHNVSYEEVVNAKHRTDKGEYAWPSIDDMNEEYIRYYMPVQEVDSLTIQMVNSMKKKLPSVICEGLISTNIYISLDRVMTLEFSANKSMIEDKETFNALKFAIFGQLGKTRMFVAALIRGNYRLRYIYKNQDDGQTLTEVTFTPLEVYDLYKYFKNKDMGVF